MYSIVTTFVPFLFSIEMFFFKKAAVEIYSPSFLLGIIPHLFFITKLFSLMTLSITSGDCIISNSLDNPPEDPDIRAAIPPPAPSSSIA